MVVFRSVAYFTCWNRKDIESKLFKSILIHFYKFLIRLRVVCTSFDFPFLSFRVGGLSFSSHKLRDNIYHVFHRLCVHVVYKAKRYRYTYPE